MLLQPPKKKCGGNNKFKLHFRFSEKEKRKRKKKNKREKTESLKAPIVLESVVEVEGNPGYATPEPIKLTEKRRLRCSIRSAVTAILVICLVFGVVPSSFAWYFVSQSAVTSIAQSLVVAIADQSVGILSIHLSDAENVVERLVETAEHTPGICDPGTHPLVDKLWQTFMTASLVPLRLNWYIGGGSQAGEHAGTYGKTSLAAYGFELPVVWLQSPDRWNDSFLCFLVTTNGTGGRNSSDNSFKVGPKVDWMSMTSAEFDTRLRPWYIIAMAHPATLTWGEVFLIVPEHFQVVTVSKTFSSSPLSSEPCGVLYAALPIEKIGQQLASSPVGKTGSLWFIEGSTGYLLTSSVNGLPTSTNGSDGFPTRIFANQSTDQLTSEASIEANKIMKLGLFKL